MKKILASVFCLLALASTTTHAQFNRHVRVINRSSSAIEYLYASNIDSRNWEEDMLGPRRVIQPGYYIDANIDDGTDHCRFDIRAVLRDGREAVSRGFNVCSNSTWTVWD
jgi:hypothetical protein